jgi:hypothetical protein
MELDLKAFDYLKLDIKKVLLHTRENMVILVHDPKVEAEMHIKVYENREEEKHEYKILKSL